MRKIIIALVMTALASTTAAAPAFAHGWDRPYYGGVVVDPLLWPITAALTLPAAIVGTVANAVVPHPVTYGYPAVPVYAGPAAYAPAPYYAPRVYVAPRGYYYPGGYYYAPRGYYHVRAYRYYRGGW